MDARKSTLSRYAGVATCQGNHGPGNSKGLAKIRWGRARILRCFKNDRRVAFVPLIIFGHGAFKET